MSASRSTVHYQLPIYQPQDTTSWLTDFNGAMEKIDTAIYAASQSGGTEVDIVQETGQSTTSVMSQKAVTDALSDIPSVEVLQETGTSQTATMSQNAITEAIASAGGGSKRKSYAFKAKDDVTITTSNTEIISGSNIDNGRYIMIASARVGGLTTSNIISIESDQEVGSPYITSQFAFASGSTTATGTTVNAVKIVNVTAGICNVTMKKSGNTATAAGMVQMMLIPLD